MSAALIKRLPKLHLPPSYPIMTPKQKADYTDFDADFTTLAIELDPAFARIDGTALRLQNRHRWQQVLLLAGSAVLTTLGGIQAALPGQRWPTIALGVLGIALTTGAAIAKSGASLNGYLVNRVKAERLRGLYFAYLSRTGRFQGDRREAELRRAVTAIDEGEELA